MAKYYGNTKYQNFSSIYHTNITYFQFSNYHKNISFQQFHVDASIRDMKQCSNVMWQLDLKPEDPEYNSGFYHQLGLFQVITCSTPWLCLYMVNWSASCRVGFLIC